MVWVARFWLASYAMSVPDKPVTFKADAAVDLPIHVLVSVQLPAAPVTHEAVPPGENRPRTVMFGTAASVSTLRTATVACARHRLELPVELAVSVFTAIVAVATGCGVPLASEKSSKLGEPVPRPESLFGLAFALRNASIARGDAPGASSSARAATPATCGVAIDVPLRVLVAVGDEIQSEVMELPGA